MKTFLTICAISATLAVAGCASQKGDADYSHENAAPYSESRTAGGEGQAVTTSRADNTFSKRQHK